MRLKNRVVTILMSTVLAFSSPLVMTSYAQLGLGIETLEEEQIWLGWTIEESGTEAYAQAGGDGGRACGRYQFDYAYSLTDFVTKTVSENPGVFPSLEKYKGVAASDESLKSAAFHTAWKEAYGANPELFSSLQDDYAYEYYYVPAKARMEAKGISTDDPVVLGTLYSLAIRDGVENGADMVVKNYSEGDTVYQWLSKIYQAEAKKHPSQSSRWAGSQMTAALNGGDTTGTIGLVGTLRSSAGTDYKDYVAEWISANPELAKGFVSSGGWNKNNQDWARTIRTAGDWAEMYGIKGGSLDFVGGISGGTFDASYQGMSAISHEVPDNGSSNPVVYFRQGEWNTKPFGGGTISSSGCSVTSFAMVLSYLRGLKAGNPYDEANWIYPDAIVDAIQAKYGDYNKFYVAPAGQDGSRLFPALASMYGIHCRQINGSSIRAAVSQKGHVVIGAMNAGTEWTKAGHFICITGIGANGGIMVNDPNGSHADKSYAEYSQEYLTSTSHGLYEFWMD